jgi:hypothetical protein
MTQESGKNLASQPPKTRNVNGPQYPLQQDTDHLHTPPRVRQFRSYLEPTACVACAILDLYAYHAYYCIVIAARLQVKQSP